MASNIEKLLGEIAENTRGGGGGGGGGSTGGGVLVVDTDDETFALDKTWQEIYDAPFVVIKQNPPGGYGDKLFIYPVEILRAEENEYVVACISSDYINPANVYPLIYKTTAPDGYPVWDIEDGEIEP